MIHQNILRLSYKFQQWYQSLIQEVNSLTFGREIVGCIMYDFEDS